MTSMGFLSCGQVRNTTAARAKADAELLKGNHRIGTGPRVLYVSGLMALSFSLPPALSPLLMAAGRQANKESDKAGAVVKPQPIPFSHRVHCGLGLKCSDCHEIPAPGWAVTYPDTGKCVQCHQVITTSSPAIRRLAAYFKQQKPVPWVQIYKLPGFVGFSHRVHVKKAGLSCETCHGPVAERDLITEEKSISMAACVDCHSAMNVPSTCVTCH
jgi:Cytochrome c7 and related cytochrome c